MEMLRKTVELLDAGETLVLVTVVSAGAGTPGKAGFKMIVTASGTLFGTVGGGALEARAVEDARGVLEGGESGLREYDLSALGMTCGGRAGLLFELLEACPDFLVFGGGHVGRALTPLLESLGFRVTVYDPRPEVRTLLPETEGRTVIEGPYEDLRLAGRLLETCRFFFIATHGHEHDYVVLKQLLEAGGDYCYVGLIGSRSKVRTTFKRLEADGRQRPPYLYAPVGLAIGGNTPAEIAVSVAAEVLAVRYGAGAPHMRDRTG
jgi:xanthine dehydrogenase accessory factor